MKYINLILPFLGIFLFLPGYGQKPAMRAGVISSMEKVSFHLDDPVVSSGVAKINAAGGEYESFQVLISGNGSGLKEVSWKVTDLKSKKGKIKAENIEVNPVGYVETTEKMDNYPGELGWWPDPLLRMNSFDVAPGERQPIWITVFVPRGTPAGVYNGKVELKSASAGKINVPVELRVWGFDIPVKPNIKTLTWAGSLKVTGDNSREARKKYYDLLLKHRLGPGGRIELDEDMLGFCMERGMNAFILDNIPNLKRAKQDAYSDEYKEKLRKRLEDYTERFGPRGWLDGMAYVYNYDEVGKKHWHLAKEMYSFVKDVNQDFRVIQCLNIPAGVEALAGYADTWDVYVAQYKKSGVEKRVAEGDEAWLAVCCYPVDRPNFFLEYPAIDGRLLGWICHQTGVTGFEYWSPNSWKDNDSAPGLRGGWKANTFLKYNGDGYLTYPGNEGTLPLSSVRLANMRDGFEDYEYLHLFKQLNGNMEIVNQVVSGPLEFTSDPNLLYSVREEIAKQIEKLSAEKK